MLIVSVSFQFYRMIPEGNYKKGLKQRTGDDPLESALETASVPATSGAHTSPMEVEDAVWDATSASSSTTRVPMSVDFAAAKGPSTTEGALPIPRDLANDILAAIPLLPNEWLLVKIDLILQNTDKYYMSWRRFLFVHELLRTFDENTAVAALRSNATRLVEHLVEFLSEWIVTFMEPAREVTKIRDPELLFLHEKDYWFRAIWQDLHLAATLDRVKSRDRPPVGLVRCICKDARSRGEEGTGSWTPVKLGVSNVHIFVPIWMIPEPVRHVRLLASRDIPPKTKGWVEYKEGMVLDQAIRSHCRIDTLRHVDPLWRSTPGTVSHGGLAAHRALCAGRHPQARGVEFPLTVAWSQSQTRDSTLWHRIQR